MTKPLPEDIGLAPEQYPDLNRQFFSAKYGPHVFLRHRLRGVLLAASNSEAVATVLEQGLALGRLETKGWVESSSEDADLQHFAALEATVLFHHAAEALLRLTLALLDDPLCPWLEVTRLRQPRVFPQGVDRLVAGLESEETQDRLATLFYFRKDRLTAPHGVEDQRWRSSLQGLTALIAECARRLKDEGAVYNSAKHGLSAVQGSAAMELMGEASPSLIQASGPSLTVLEPRRRSDDGRRQWHQTTHWVRADSTLAMTYLVTQQIENLWNVARARYLEVKEDRAITPLAIETLREMQKMEFPGSHFLTSSMSMSLLYMSEDHPAARDARQGGSSRKGGRRRRRR